MLSNKMLKGFTFHGQGGEKMEDKNKAPDLTDELINQFYELSNTAKKTEEPERKISLVECMLGIYKVLFKS